MNEMIERTGNRRPKQKLQKKDIAPSMSNCPICANDPTGTLARLFHGKGDERELGCPVCGETWTEFSYDENGYATCENGHRLRSAFWRQEARKRNFK